MAQQSMMNGVKERPYERAGGFSKVWATLITNTDYLPGVLVLAYSLRESHSVYPLVVLYTDATPGNVLAELEQHHIATRQIPELKPPVELNYGNDPRFKEVWNKLAVYELLEYERVVLLDSDMLVLQNMDELMDISLDTPSLKGQGNKIFAAAPVCVCNPLKRPHYPEDWVPENCAYTSQHGDPESAQLRGASNLLSHSMPNCGVLVVNPTHEVYEQIVEKLKDEAACSSYIFPEQGLLVDLYAGRWVTLPYVYNALRLCRPSTVHGPIWRDDRVKNIHYIMVPKPWNESPGKISDETFAWWHDCNRRRVSHEEQNTAH